VLDMNDRALREIVCSLGGVANGYPREAGFDITVASEVMAIFCLAAISTISRSGSAISSSPTRATANRCAPATSRAHGAMTALLKDAIAPNLVQTLEGTPAFIHGGPFANIAHGCNSVLATTTALKLADYVVTEAGFGADLGGEKFLDIKCRKAGLKPDCVVLVATIRALKMHGGVKKEDLKKENLKALEAGMATSSATSRTSRSSICPVISINRFSADTDAEIALVKDKCKALGVEALDGRSLGDGRRGRGRCRQGRGQGHRQRQEQAEIALSRRHAAVRKIRTIAKEIYRADDATADKSVRISSPGRRWASASCRSASPRRNIQLLDQSGRQGRADRFNHSGARSAALGRRRVRGRDLRRDHDHAGPAESAGGRFDRRRAGWQDRRIVL
jgi:formate--tetrahydrofolate ligase